MAVHLDVRASGYSRENAWLLAEISLITYRESDTWAVHLAELGFSLARCFDKGATQALLATTDDARVLSFRGTEFNDPRDLIADARARRVPGPWGKVHHGTCSELDRLWPQLSHILAEGGAKPLWITGHSMGAGMAILAAARLHKEGIPIQGVFAYGTPKPGDADFAAGFEAALGVRTWRFVNDKDVVPRLMGETSGYRHVGRLVYFDGEGTRHFERANSHWFKEMLEDPTARPTPGGGPPEGMADHLVSCYAKVTRADLER